MHILVKDITEDSSQSIIYYMHGNTIIAANIVSKDELNQLINEYSELIDSGEYSFERMNYNEYINQ